MSKQSVSKHNHFPPLDHVLTTLRAHLPELRQRYGIRSLAVFGSYVRAEQKRGSDLDLLVEFDDRGLSLFDFVKIENYLSEILGVKVDLVERSTLKPAIGRHILEEALPI
ncbi:MAG: nucleotidyltransferase family protein [Deltaproteobacteria bacterium]|nr:nucleotidyltransferase family protein [Deltaproteobacteria bacterium]